MSDRFVRLYVVKRKKELQEQSESAALPLEVRPATAQVDFGETPFVYKGERVMFFRFRTALLFSSHAFSKQRMLFGRMKTNVPFHAMKSKTR